MYPLQSTKRQLNNAVKKGYQKIKREISPFDWNILNYMRKLDPITQGSYSKINSPDRLRFRQQIASKPFQDKRSIDRKDPDLYILGGVAASGKTSALRKKIKEKVIIIDNDAIKAQLAKRTPSPSRRFGLIHSPYVHEEASEIAKLEIERARREKRNVVIDTTLNNLEKNKAIIERFKRDGYDIHELGTQIRPHQAIERATERFLTGAEGRFVPLLTIAMTGNNINRNVMKARRYVDSYEIVDTSDYNNPKVVSKSKYDLNHNFRNP